MKSVPPDRGAVLPLTGGGGVVYYSFGPLPPGTRVRAVRFACQQSSVGGEDSLSAFKIVVGSDPATTAAMVAAQRALTGSLFFIVPPSWQSHDIPLDFVADDNERVITVAYNQAGLGTPGGFIALVLEPNS